MIGIAFMKNLNEKLCRSNRLIALGRAGEKRRLFSFGKSGVFRDGFVCSCGRHLLLNVS
ncbi:MAG: hypothetical protein ACLT2S_02015 [Christensenellales bacterium]